MAIGHIYGRRSQASHFEVIDNAYSRNKQATNEDVQPIALISKTDIYPKLDSTEWTVKQAPAPGQTFDIYRRRKIENPVTFRFYTKISLHLIIY